MNTNELIICTSPDGWSLHAPGSTDAAIACGDAVVIASGPGQPTQADIDAAENTVIAADSKNAEIIQEIVQSDFADWRFQNGPDMDALMGANPHIGFMNYLDGYTIELFRQEFIRRGGVLLNGDAAPWFAMLMDAADDVLRERDAGPGDAAP